MDHNDELCKTTQLFMSHLNDAELHFRHLAALDKLCRASGFAVHDLPNIANILHCTLQLLHAGHCDEFLEPACNLVRAIGRPYIKRQTTDELRLQTNMCRLLTVMADTFDEQLPWKLQTCTAQALEQLSSVWGSRQAAGSAEKQALAELDLQSPQRLHHIHARMLHDSQTAPALCAALRRALVSPSLLCSANPDARATQQAHPASQPQQQQHSTLLQSAAELDTLVSALLEFSKSPLLCKQLLQSGVVPVLAQLLVPEAEAGLDTRRGSQIIELLWNLFEYAPEVADALEASREASPAGQHDVELTSEQPDSPACTSANMQPSMQPSAAADISGSKPAACAAECTGLDCLAAPQLLEVLAVALQRQIAGGMSFQNRQQRNDTLTVLYLLSRCTSFSRQLVQNSSLLQLISAAALPTAQQSQVQSADVSQQHLTAGSLPCTSDRRAIEADNSMQMLAWSILGKVVTTSDSQTASVFKEELLRVLLATVAFGVCVFDHARRRDTAWLDQLTPEQMLASKQLAWLTLKQVVPLCAHDFTVIGGVRVMLDSLIACSSSASTSSSAWLCQSTATAITILDKSMNKTNCDRNDSTAAKLSSRCSSAEPVLHLMRHLITCSTDLTAAMLEHGSVVVLLQMLQAPAAATLTSIRQGALICLAELCSVGGRAARSAVRDAGGIEQLLMECHSILEGDPYVPSLAALNALWRCCVPSSRSRARLLAADGMDVLLSLLQRGNPALRPVTLSLLADLLSDKQAHGLFWEWHAPIAAGSSGWSSSSSSSFSVPRCSVHKSSSDSSGGAVGMCEPPMIIQHKPASWLLAHCGKGPASTYINSSSSSISGVQLLVSIWKHQEDTLSVHGRSGGVTNVDRSLGGGLSSANRQQPAPGHGSVDGTGLRSASGLTMLDRQAVFEKMTQAGSPQLIMEKVHACFASLGIAGSKDASAVSADGLSALQQLPPADVATLVAIQHYTAFRQGEVWQDIQAGFDAEGAQLTLEDSMRLQNGIQQAQAVAAQVQAAQAELLAAAEAQKLAVEKMIYDNMAAQAAADAKAKVYQKDNSKLTMRERLAAKVRKEEMLLRQSCDRTGS